MQALVDMADLTAERQAHLGQCADCRKDLERLEQRFVRLERMARQMTPSPSRSFRLPQKTAPQVWWRFKPMWAAGLSAVLVLAVVLWWPGNFKTHSPVTHVAVQEPAASDSLLDQVDALIDNPLPPVLQQLAVTSDLDDSDDVIDWVVPAVDDIQDEDDETWT